MTSRKPEPFYVGYLPTPESLRRRYLWLTPLIVALGLGAGFLFSSAQQGAGTGTWATASPVTLAGTITVDPYAVLHTVDGESALLVMFGKRGAAHVAGPHAGTHVEVTGNPIRRGGLLVLELAGPEAVVPASGTPIAVSTVPGRSTTLTGEIVDTKCFLGVMKPGAGKVHRACAALCLRGGMPPMIVSRSGSTTTGHLLIGSTGEDMSRQLADLAGIPVQLAGTVE